MPPKKSALLAAVEPTEPVGPGSDEDFTYHSERVGDVTVSSLSKIDPSQAEPFRYTLAMAEDNENIRTAKLVVLMAEVAAGDNWPKVKAYLSKLNGDEFKEFNEQWAAHSGISAGE